MSEDDKNHWEERYSGNGCELKRSPSALLTKWLDKCNPGRALDLACGTGRNALYLAEKGCDVTAVDISPSAISTAGATAREQQLRINWIVADLDNYVIAGQYDLIIISFFTVSSNMVPLVINALKQGGILLSENHMLSPSFSDDEARNHRFHLKPGELRIRFSGLTMICYEECRVGEKDDRPLYRASLVAQKE